MNEHDFHMLAGLLYRELRSPLTSITGFAELLRDQSAPLNEGQAEIVHTIQRVGNRCFRLVHDLYQVMLLRAGDTALVCQTLELNTVIANALDQAQPALRAAGITMAFERSDIPAVIAADPTYINVLLDYLVWDMEHAPNTPVSIKTSHRSGGIRIDIQAGYHVVGQNHIWPRPLVAFLVESILGAHGGSMVGGLNREFSMYFPG